MFISDNDINIKTRDNTPKLSLVTNVMEYFKDLAKNGSKENQEKIFIEICTKRIRGEEQGYIKLEDKEIEDIAREVLKNSKAWPNINEKNFPGEKQPYAGAAYGIARLMRHDFRRIEKFIENNDKHPLTNAFKGSLKGRINTEYDNDRTLDTISYESYNLAHNNEAGYAIISLGSGIENEKIHAESQMIDYLLFTRVIQNAKEPIYIGISKLCCSNCAKTIKACNEYKGQEETIKTTSAGKEINYQEYIEKRGDHDMFFVAEKPIFLREDYERPKGTLDYLKKGNLGYFIDVDGIPQEIKINDNLNKIAIDQGKENVHIYIDYITAQKIQNQESTKSLNWKKDTKKTKLEGTTEKTKSEKGKFILQQDYSSTSEESETEKGNSLEERLKSFSTEEIIKGCMLRARDKPQALATIKKLSEELGIVDIELEADSSKDYKRKQEHKVEQQNKKQKAEPDKPDKGKGKVGKMIETFSKHSKGKPKEKSLFPSPTHTPPGSPSESRGVG